MARNDESALPSGVPAIEDRDEDDRLRRLHDEVRLLLHAHREALQYHGWLHTCFVTKYAIEFADEWAADELLVGCAALVHDLNYVVRPSSEPPEGFPLATKMLSTAGFSEDHVDRVQDLVREAYTATRGPDISREGACLSDADSLFKALPFTPLLLGRSFLEENDVTLRELATKIVREQTPLLDDDAYFYLPSVRTRYNSWARANVALWQRTLDALADEDLTWLADQMVGRGGREHQ